MSDPVIITKKNRLLVLDAYCRERLKVFNIPDNNELYFRATPLLDEKEVSGTRLFSIPVSDIPVFRHGRVECIDKFSLIGFSTNHQSLDAARTGIDVNFENVVHENILKILARVFNEFEKNKIPVIIIGGAVRDAILQRSTRDVDLLLPWIEYEKLRHLVHKAAGSHPSINRQFGTATLNLPYGRIDFALIRKENYSSPFLLPEVSPGTIRTDLLRRDYTVNGLFASPEGCVYDTMGGAIHLKSRTLLTMTTVSFLEDPTRILRGWRFEIELGMKLSDEFLPLMQDAISRGAFRRIEGHRIWAEFKLCSRKSLYHLFKKCAEHGIWKELGIEELESHRLVEILSEEMPATVEHMLELISNHLNMNARYRMGKRLRLNKKHLRILKLV